MHACPQLPVADIRVNDAAYYPHFNEALLSLSTLLTRHYKRASARLPDLVVDDLDRTFKKNLLFKLL